jgi:hypothetical protein
MFTSSFLTSESSCGKNPGRSDKFTRPDDIGLFRIFGEQEEKVGRGG